MDTNTCGARALFRRQAALELTAAWTSTFTGDVRPDPGASALFGIECADYLIEKLELQEGEE